MRRGIVPRTPAKSPHRRQGLSVVSTLLEILLIGLLIWGVVSMIPAVLHVPTVSSTSKSTRQMDPIFRLAKTSDQIWAQLGNSEVVSVDLQTLKTRSVYRTTTRPIREFHVSHDGATMLVSLDTRELVILRNDELLIREPVADGLGVELALSTNGQTAVFCFGRTKIRCWSLTRSNPTCFDYELSEKVDRVLLDPSGETLIVSTLRGQLQLYEAKTGVRLKSAIQPQPMKGCPVLSDDGKWLGIVSGESLTMYDMQSFEIAWTVQTGPRDELQNMAISSNGQLIAVAGCHAEIQIFELASGTLVSRIPIDDAVNRMLICGERLYIAAANSSAIRVVTLPTGQQRKSIDLL